MPKPKIQKQIEALERLEAQRKREKEELENSPVKWQRQWFRDKVATTSMQIEVLRRKLGYSDYGLVV